MIGLRSAVFVAVVLVAAPSAAAAQRGDRDGWDVTRLTTWLRVVETHVPGQIDGALIAATAWTRDDLQLLWIDVQVLLRLAERPGDTRFRVQPLAPRAGVPGAADTRVTVRFSPAQRSIVDDLADRVRASGVNAVAKRAALVHTDVATLTPDRIAVSAGPVSMDAPLRMMIGDGQTAGAEAVSTHWDLARVLVASVSPAPGRDPWVRDWYRATLALGQQVESFDSLHLDHALRHFPDDPGILFLAGCQHEAFAAPLMQEFARGFRGSRFKPDIESEGAELRRAERLFRQALAGDPAHHEARLRLGRVLAVTGRPEAAAAELRRALHDTDDRQLQYYAALFLGAALERTATAGGAEAAYLRAAELAPQAPAPHLALARLAQRAGDRRGLAERLSLALAPPASPDDADPWWTYRAAQGRTAAAQLDEVRRTWARNVP